jgi:hypothetical protein
MRRLVAVSSIVAAMFTVLLLPSSPASAEPAQASCWGQASAAYARLGEMGSHASEQTVPRVGLRNLARSLAAEDVIEDDSMQSLGAFVAVSEGLFIASCQ